MTLDEVKERLGAAGLIPICVSNEPPRDGDRLTIAGGLTEYLEAVRGFGAKTVIVYSQIFVEEYFLHDSRDADDGSEGDDDDKGETLVDLCVANKELRRFKDFLGRCAMVRLSVQMQSDYLDLVIEEPWRRDFLDIRARITGKLDEEREQRLAAENAQEQAEVAGLIARLHELTNDATFAALRTQKAMLQYAVRRIPELDSIDLSDLRREIQEIKAQIDAGS